MKVKSLTKLSLSHCQLQGIDTSLKSCVELVELRLAHNEIKSLPDELVHNSKLRNLDVGNNVISKWSELEVLKSLTKLKNLNLQGNPVAANDKVTRKIKKALPRLQIFNARPVDKDTKNDDNQPIGENEDDHLEIADELDFERKSGKKRKKNADVSEKENTVLNKDNADRKKDKLVSDVESDVKNKSSKKKLRKDEKPLDKGLAVEENVNGIEKKMKKKGKNEKQSELDVIDDADASFMDFFNTKDAENLNHGGEINVQDKVPKDLKLASNKETSSTKRKSGKMQKNMESLESPVTEIGIGGPSTWGDE